jgi:hypothetical protein
MGVVACIDIFMKYPQGPNLKLKITPLMSYAVQYAPVRVPARYGQNKVCTGLVVRCCAVRVGFWFQCQKSIAGYHTKVGR